MTAHSSAQVQREQEFMRTADMVNTFVISTTQFLNRFAARCDTKLFETHRALQRLEVLTILLEKKLDSVDEDDTEGGAHASAALPAALSSAPNAATGSSGAGLFAPPQSNAPPPMPGLLPPQAQRPLPPPTRSGPPPPPGAAFRGKSAKSVHALSTRGGPAPPPMPGRAEQKTKVPLPPPMPLLGGFAMSAHPKLRVFFEMLALRIPVEAIKAKMVADGYQPDWLDTPDVPAPTNIPVEDGIIYDSE